MEDIRLPGSCGWLASQDMYYGWQSSHSLSKPIFLLTGKAGSGKSVISPYVINDLQQHGQKCRYFFFKNGHSANSTTSACLRSLAYKMAMSDVTTLQSLLDSQRDAPPWTKSDNRTIWRKFFLGCLFNQGNSVRHIWVIDGLDECEEFAAFLSLISEIPSCLSIFLTCRNGPAIDKGLRRIEQLVGCFQMREQDTVDDISAFH